MSHGILCNIIKISGAIWVLCLYTEMILEIGRKRCGCGGGITKYERS